jgi:hypothetical protein
LDCLALAGYSVLLPPPEVLGDVQLMKYPQAASIVCHSSKSSTELADLTDFSSLSSYLLRTEGIPVAVCSQQKNHQKVHQIF